MKYTDVYFSLAQTKVLFPIIPQTCDLERMKNGGEHWQWNPDIPFYLGVLPRRGAKGSDIKVGKMIGSDHRDNKKKVKLQSASLLTNSIHVAPFPHASGSKRQTPSPATP